MAIQNFTGFETGDQLEGVFGGGGGASIQSTTKRTGTYALRVNISGGVPAYFAITNTYGATGVHTAFNMADAYTTFYYRYTSKPGSGSEEICSFQNSTNTKLAIRINSSGNLLAYDVTTLLGTGSTVLSADTWYRIEARCQPGTNGNWEIKIDGTSEISGTRTWTNAGNVTGISYGERTNRSSQTQDFYIDDICIDDAAFPGPGRILIAVPVSGSHQGTGWNDGPAGAVYTEVDDVPNDGDTTYCEASATDDGLDCSFPVQDSATIGIVGSIKAVKSMTYAKTASVSGTSAVNLLTWSGGSSFGLTPLELTTSYQVLAKIYETDPLDSAAWTTTKFDTIEVGMQAGALAQTQRFTIAYAMVWEDGVVSAGTAVKDLIGVGYIPGAR